ncbi:MAG: hypothetical protein Q9160_001195 [Pyrenula sp. 1 TL-2023]
MKAFMPSKLYYQRILQLYEVKQKDAPLEILSNPEFLVGGSAVASVMDPDRVVIGFDRTPKGLTAAKRLQRLYSCWVPAERIITTDMRSSELAKLASNAMLAQRVSNVSALSMLCEEFGADVSCVTQVIGADRRIGKSMLRAGPGFGGSCLRKDTMYLVDMAERIGCQKVADYWRSVVTMNEIHMDRLSERVMQRLEGNLTDKVVTILGFTFKEGVVDTRDSPCIPMVKALSSAGARVKIFDPRLTSKQIADTLHSEGLTHGFRNESLICNDIWSACKDASVLIFTSLEEKAFDQPDEMSPGEHCEQLKMEASRTALSRFDWKRLYASMVKPRMILDCWNRVDFDDLRKLGFVLEGVGRGIYQVDASQSQAALAHPESTTDGDVKTLNVGVTFADSI